jgi:hypothetical protein
VLAIRFHGKRAVLVVVSLVCQSESLLMVHQTVASPERMKAEKALGNQGDAEAGRNVFNGKGICHYCHDQQMTDIRAWLRTLPSTRRNRRRIDARYGSHRGARKWDGGRCEIK